MDPWTFQYLDSQNNLICTEVMKAPVSHEDAVAQLHLQYVAGVKAGTIVPFVYPIATLALGIGLLFSLIPPTSRFHNRFTRYAVFAFISCWHAYIVASCKGFNPSSGFGVGAMTTFGTLWAAVLLLFNDAKASFKRIGMHRQAIADGSGNFTNVAEKSEYQRGNTTPTSDTTFFWQSYPAKSLKSRLFWVLDLWINFRLIGWKEKVSGMPSYPQSVQKQLNSSEKKDSDTPDYPMTKAGLGRYDLTSSLIRHNLYLFLSGYLLLDVFLTFSRYDPYFRGDVDAPPPQSLPSFVKAHPNLLVRGYRLSTGLIFIWLGLRTILVLGPLCFVGILGEKRLGVWGMPWLYPDHYGSYKNFLEHGIAGWWAGWWHQSFRCVFQTTSNFILESFSIVRNSMKGKVVTLFTSFFLSGAIHASGSRTQQGQTHPLTGSMMFFMLQPCGIIIEILVRSAIQRRGLSHRSPQWLVYGINLIWVYFWFWLTAPFFVDDMARGGLFLTELLPLSPLKAMGFGVESNKGIRWSGPITKWHTGEHWYSSGFAL